MTNLQLLLSIGVPSLLIVLSWIQQASRIARLEASTDRGFEAVDRKFEAVERQFEAVERKFEAMRHEMIALRDSIRRGMISLHERVAVVEAKHTS